MWLKTSSTRIVNASLIPEITIGKSKDGKYFILANSVFNSKLNPLADDLVFDDEETAKQALVQLIDQFNGNNSQQIIIPEGMLQYV